MHKTPSTSAVGGKMQGRGCWNRRETERAGHTDRTHAHAGQQRVWGVAFGDTHASKQVGGTPPHTRVYLEGKWPTTPGPRSHSQDRQGATAHKVPRCAHKHKRGLLPDKTNQPTVTGPAQPRCNATHHHLPEQQQPGNPLCAREPAFCTVLSTTATQTNDKLLSFLPPGGAQQRCITALPCISAAKTEGAPTHTWRSHTDRQTPHRRCERTTPAQPVQPLARKQCPGDTAQ